MIMVFCSEFFYFLLLAENSTKIIQSITWRSTSSRSSSSSSSCKSLVASNSKSSSTWTEFKNDLFDDYGGMDSGSHSLTLGRLYAWEKKLYEEVKVSINLPSRIKPCLLASELLC